VRIFKRRLQQFVEASAERHAAGDGPWTPRPLATRRERLER